MVGWVLGQRKHKAELLGLSTWLGSKWVSGLGAAEQVCRCQAVRREKGDCKFGTVDRTG